MSEQQPPPDLRIERASDGWNIRGPPGRFDIETA